MADKKESILERVYTIPLRKEYLKAPNWKRTKKAVSAVREFMVRHMKSKNIKLGKEVNEKLWQHGIRNPPHHLKVTATKNEEGEVRVELFGIKKESKATKKTKTEVKSKSTVEQKVEEVAAKTQ